LLIIADWNQETKRCCKFQEKYFITKPRSYQIEYLVML